MIAANEQKVTPFDEMFLLTKRLYVKECPVNVYEAVRGAALTLSSQQRGQKSTLIIEDCLKAAPIIIHLTRVS